MHNLGSTARCPVWTYSWCVAITRCGSAKLEEYAVFILPFRICFLFNPSYTGGLFHCYMLGESICHFIGVESILLLSFYFLWEMLANNVVLDETQR